MMRRLIRPWAKAAARRLASSPESELARKLIRSWAKAPQRPRRRLRPRHPPPDWRRVPILAKALESAQLRPWAAASA